MDELGSSEDSSKIRIDPDTLPIEVRELWENMLMNYENLRIK